MITIVSKKGVYPPRFAGLSTDNRAGLNWFSAYSWDALAAEHRNAAEFYELDTGKNYRYDAQNQVWYEFSSGGGGGGGSVSPIPNIDQVLTAGNVTDNSMEMVDGDDKLSLAKNGVSLSHTDLAQHDVQMTDIAPNSVVLMDDPGAGTSRMSHLAAGNFSMSSSTSVTQRNFTVGLNGANATVGGDNETRDAFKTWLQVGSGGGGGFTREFPDLMGIAVEVLSDPNDTPTTQGVHDDDVCFTLIWDGTSSWLTAAWFWDTSSSSWSISAPYLPVPAEDMHYVVIEQGGTVSGLYILGTSPFDVPAPQWVPLGADMSDYYTKQETEQLIDTKLDGYVKEQVGTSFSCGQADFQSTLDSLGKYLTSGNMSVSLHEDVTGYFEVKGLIGDSPLTIDLNGRTVHGVLTVSGCTVPVRIQYGTIDLGELSGLMMMASYSTTVEYREVEFKTEVDQYHNPGTLDWLHVQVAFSRCAFNWASEHIASLNNNTESIIRGPSTSGEGNFRLESGARLTLEDRGTWTGTIDALRGQFNNNIDHKNETFMRPRNAVGVEPFHELDVQGDELQSVLDALGKYLSSDIVIHVTSDISTSVTVKGFLGPGALYIDGQQRQMTGLLEVLGNHCRIYVSNLSIDYGNVSGNLVIARDNSDIEFEGAVFSATGQHTLEFNGGSYMFRACTFVAYNVSLGGEGEFSLVESSTLNSPLYVAEGADLFVGGDVIDNGNTISGTGNVRDERLGNSGVDNISDTWVRRADGIRKQKAVSLAVTGTGLQSLLDSLGKWLNGNVTITLTDNIPANRVTLINGFQGPGTLQLNMNGYQSLSGRIAVTDCSCEVYIRNGTITIPMGNQVVTSRCAYVRFEEITFTLPLLVNIHNDASNVSYRDCTFDIGSSSYNANLVSRSGSTVFVQGTQTSTITNGSNFVYLAVSLGSTLTIASNVQSGLFSGTAADGSITDNRGDHIMETYMRSWVYGNSSNTPAGMLWGEVPIYYMMVAGRFADSGSWTQVPGQASGWAGRSIRRVEIAEADGGTYAGGARVNGDALEVYVLGVDASANNMHYITVWYTL